MATARARRSLRRRLAIRGISAFLVLCFVLPFMPAVGTESASAIGFTLAPSTFGTRVMINDARANTQTSPVALSLPGQGVFVAWVDDRYVAGDLDIYTSTSLDGVTFTPNVRADDSSRASRQFAPAAALAPDGSIVLVWQDNRRITYDYDIYFTKSVDGGRTFSRNVKVDDSVPDPRSWQERPSVAVTASGIIYVAWVDDRGSDHIQRVRGAFSTDGGATFSASSEIAPAHVGSGQTGVSLAANGNLIYAAFMDNFTGTVHPYLAISADGGLTFSEPTRIDSAGNNGALQRDVSIAPLPNGGIAATWDDMRSGNWDIYAALLRADGTVLRSDMRVDSGPTNVYRQNGRVATDRAGTVYIVWEEEKDNASAVRFAYLKVNSPAFTPAIDVSTPRADDMQRRPAIVATSPGQVFVAWQDDRLTTYDVYGCVGYFPNLFDLKLVKGWNFVCVPLVGWGYKASTLGLATGSIVVAWDQSNSSFGKSYVVGVSPISWDFAIAEGEGYWIFVTSAQVLKLNGTVPGTAQSRTINVPAGGCWVSLGLSSLRTSLRASDIPGMYSTPGGIKMVMSYNATTCVYSPYYPGMPAWDFPLVPGNACYLYCTASGVLTYNP